MKPQEDAPVGKVFGSWTVTGFSHRDTNTAWWRVRCACGNDRVQRSWVLTSGKSLRCGDCAARRGGKALALSHARQLVGTVVSGWTVLAYTGIVSVHNAGTTMWACQCIVCGAVVDIPRTVLGKATMPVCRHGSVPERVPEVEE